MDLILYDRDLCHKPVNLSTDKVLANQSKDSFKVRFKPPEVPIDNQLLLTK